MDPIVESDANVLVREENTIRMRRADFSRLSVDATVGDLPLFDYCVDWSTLLQDVYHTFRNAEGLPGVIIRKDSQTAHMLSTRKCAELLSHPFVPELFLRSSIGTLVVHFKLSTLQVPAELTIAEAASRCLRRATDSVYEPILVTHASGEVGLLDVYDLLLAQSHILGLSNKALRWEMNAVEQAKQRLEHEMTARERAQEEVRQLARFPDENPEPVFRVGGEALVLYANDASQPILENWGTREGDALPAEVWARLQHAASLGTQSPLAIVCGAREFELIVAPVLEYQYVNVYGRDVTERKDAERQLRRHGRRAL